MAAVFTGWFQVTNASNSNSEGLSLHIYCSYTHEFKQLTNLFFENSNVFFKRLEHHHHHRSCLRCITMFSLGLTFFKNNIMLLHFLIKCY